MEVFALLVIAVCVPVLIKAHRVLGEIEGKPDERVADWQWPARWDRSCSTEDDR
jgi:hypothetical protein